MLPGRTLFLMAVLTLPAAAAAQRTVPLDHGWQVQTSAMAGTDGVARSTDAPGPSQWYDATLPATVGEILRANRDTDTSARRFTSPWWFRKVFEIAAPVDGERVLLVLEGVSFGAEVYMNGSSLGKVAAFTPGAPSALIDVTDTLRSYNIIAILVSPSRTATPDLGIPGPVYLRILPVD